METSLNWKGTKEKEFYSEDEFTIYADEDFTQLVASFNRLEDKELFTDALHTIQECDKTPSQLREENTKLKEALKGSLEVIENLLASKRIVNLDEAIAFYKQLLNS